MHLLYVVEAGSCGKRIGLPQISRQKAMDAAWEASIIHGDATVCGMLPGLYTISAIFENGIELPPERWSGGDR